MPVIATCEHCGEKKDTYKIREAQIFESETLVYIQLCIECLNIDETDQCGLMYYGNEH